MRRLTGIAISNIFQILFLDEATGISTIQIYYIIIVFNSI